jgi:hypothetical protein
MKIRRDRIKTGRRVTGGYGIMWYRGKALWHLHIRLVPRVPIEITWARREVKE